MAVRFPSSSANLVFYSSVFLSSTLSSLTREDCVWRVFICSRIVARPDEEIVGSSRHVVEEVLA